MKAQSLFSSGRSRTGFVGVLLLGALTLSGVLAYQAIDAGRSHETVALKAVKEQALFAAWEFSRTARNYIDEKLLKPGLEVVAKNGGKKAEELLLCPLTDEGADHGNWKYGPVASGAFFRFDAETGAVVVAGPSDPGLASWVETGLSESLAAGADNRWDPVMVSPEDEGGPITYRTFPAGEDDPEIVFGLRLRPDAIGIPLGYLFEDVPLLPEALTRGRKNAELFSVVVSTADGEEVWRSGDLYESPFVATDTIGRRYGDLMTSVTVNPRVAESLVIGGFPRSRLPLVGGLLLLTVGLVVGALFQLRREAELSQLRADFVSSVSHELRTPLAQIRMFAETLMLGRVRSEEESARSLEIIVNESRRLTHQVENVLLYSRAERDDFRVDAVPTDTCALIRDVAESFTPLAERARCRIRVEAPEKVVGLVDGSLVRQVLLNLMDNAVKYGPPGQTIVLATGPGPEGTIRVSVEDQGPGIPKRDRARIFEPYFRLGAHVESSVAGSGIGLSVVWHAVKALRGTITVEDVEAGGARFVLELPAASAGVGA